MYVKEGQIAEVDIMTVIGITGPSGSGKGECSKYLLQMGNSVLDADAI